ncbi:MAG: hypothetical protein PHS82_15325 [Lachnospiraceae bacterium]|nr:hypothetical protein [Lachnospiraceae bacterium]
MKLLFFVLNKPEKLDDVLTNFADHDIHGATIVDSKGMVRLLNKRHDEDEIPFLGSVRAYLNPSREKSNLIITALEDEKVEAAVTAIEEIVGSLNKKDTGVVFTVPIDFAKGLYKDGK